MASASSDLGRESADTTSFQARAYVSSQLGFSETGRFLLEQLIDPKLREAGIVPLNPFETCAALIDFEQLAQIKKEGTARELEDFWRSFNVQVCPTNNKLMMQADCMALVLDGGHAGDDGACSELGYMAGKYPDKPVFALRTDFRAADNMATTVNAQLLGYITQEGRSGGLYTSVDEWARAIDTWAQTVFPSTKKDTAGGSK